MRNANLGSSLPQADSPLREPMSGDIMVMADMSYKVIERRVSEFSPHSRGRYQLVYTELRRVRSKSMVP